MKYKELTDMLPKLVAKLAKMQSNDDEKMQYLFSVITSLSAMMPRVHVFSRHTGDSVNLSYINLEDQIEDESIYDIKYLLKEVNEEITKRAKKDNHDELKENVPYEFIFNNGCDSLYLLESLKYFENYGNLLITNMPQDYLALLTPNRRTYRYYMMRLLMDNEEVCLSKDMYHDEIIQLPRISMILSGITSQILSLAKEKDQVNLSRFLFTRTNHTHFNFMLGDPDFERLHKLSEKNAHSLKKLFVKLQEKDYEVTFTKEQRTELDQYFISIVTKCPERQKGKCLAILEEYLHNLIKLGSVLTVIRAYEEKRLEESLIATDNDFHAAFELIKMSLHICLNLYSIQFTY